MSGLDIHGGLRIWWEGLRPRFTAEYEDRIQAIADTQHYLRKHQDRVNFATAWLAAMEGRRGRAMTPADLLAIEMRRERAFEEMAMLSGRRNILLSAHIGTESENILVAALKDNEALAAMLKDAWGERSRKGAATTMPSCDDCEGRGLVEESDPPTDLFGENYVPGPLIDLFGDGSEWR